MDLHSLLYSDSQNLSQVQLVVNAEDLRKCFDAQERWIRSVISDATNPEYYTRSEVSKLLHITLPTVDRWVETGKLPKPSKNGRRVLFNKASVQYVLNQNKK